MPKTEAEIEATEAEQRAHREELAREANRKRNQEKLDRLNAIADGADRVKDEEEDLEPLTDEVWAQEDGTPPRKSRAEQVADQDAEEEEEDASAVVARAEREDRDLDEARDAGADDIRKSAQGVTQYRLVVNGKEKWVTLEQLRESAGKVEAADEYLRDAKAGATREPTHGPSPEALEAQRQAEERREATVQAQKAHLKDLYTRASMGDEQAIDELAEIQVGPSRVTPDVLRIVNEQVDARMVGRNAFERAVEWFETEYVDELSTNTLKAYAARRDRELATENPDLDVKLRLKAVGDEMRQLRRDLGGQPARGQPRTPSKADRKAAAPQVPSAAGRQRPDTEPEEAESAQEAIARMAKSRGQARAIKH